MLSNFSFDGGNHNFLINNILDVDEYEIKTEFYEKREKQTIQDLFGLPFVLYSTCEDIEAEVPEGEKEREIVYSKKEKTNITYIY